MSRIERVIRNVIASAKLAAQTYVNAYQFMADVQPERGQKIQMSGYIEVAR